VEKRVERVFDCLFKMLNKYFLSGRGGNCHVAAGRGQKSCFICTAVETNAGGKSGKATESAKATSVAMFLLYLFTT